MRAPFSKLTPARALGLATLALLPLGSTAWFAMGQLQPAVATARPAPVPERPSYLVAVRAPTPDEMQQRRALADVERKSHVLELALQRDPVTLRPGRDELADPDQTEARVTTAVNVRSGPGTDTAILRVADTGAKVVILEERDGWSRVNLPELGEGWISSQFLAR